MNEGQQVLTAVCGQKCGTVEVPMADTKDCPQCGHPLTGAPTVAGEASVGDQAPKPAEKPPLPSGADLDAAAAEESARRATAAVWPTGGKVADGSPILNVRALPETKDNILVDIEHALIAIRMLPDEVKHDALHIALALALVAVGYAAREAEQLASNAIANVGK